MKFKNLLRLVATIGLIMPTSISVVACSNQVSKTNLDTIVSLTNLDLIVSTNKTFANLSTEIVKSTQFTNKPLTKYKITYWTAATRGTQVQDTEMQKSGIFYVVITADKEDSNWTGSTSNTNRLKIDVKNNFMQLQGSSGAVIGSVYDSSKDITYFGTWDSQTTGAVYQYNGSGPVVALPPITGAVNTLLTVNGDLYVGVQTNLTQFTGKVYKYENSTWNELTGTTGIIRSLAATSDGTIYAGTQTAIGTGSVYKLENDTFTEVTGTTGSVVNLVVMNNIIYAGTISNNPFVGDLYQYNGTDTFTAVANKPAGGVFGLTVDSNNFLYLLLRVDNNTTKVYRYTNDFDELISSNLELISIAVDNNVLYVGSEGSPDSFVYRFDYDANQLVKLTGTVGKIRAISFDILNKCYITTDQDNFTGSIYISN